MSTRAPLKPWTVSVNLTDQPDGTRKCGACTLCCRLVPVAALNKKAGDRCPHQRQSCGCNIYPKRPLDCRAWSCAWLASPEARNLPRPDHAHYVVDQMTDELYFTDNNTGEVTKQEALQIWVDPLHPDAWRDPKLAEYMAFVAETYGLLIMIRYGNDGGIAIAPPAVSGNGKWGQRPLGPPNPKIGRYASLPDHEKPPL